MRKQQTFQRLQEAGIVAVMRHMKPDTVIPIVSALRRAGIDAVEITVEHPDGFAAIERLKQAFPEDLLLGAGTLLDAESAKHAMNAGADFLVTPVLKEEIIQVSNRYGLLHIAGAMTPTEILTAFEWGADIVKIFPAESLGPSYLKHVKGPLGQIPLMPTGGIGLKNMGAYIKNGAICIGVGSELYRYDTPEEIEQAAAQFVKTYQQIIND